MVSKIKGYQGVCVMASRMSTDKVDAIKAFGVKVVRTPPGDLGTQNCIFNVSQTLCRETPNSLILDQVKH